uniref:NADH-ubiquinone oxidoreductase chain 3 n=1 Tax=Phoronopsis harmeri TaxID=490051 RepID=J9PPL2_9BILA|nr:NADH dehydrogenase subunit 3 [Phoronopsis harmeri]AES86294.1 NADH dehydrogenase subunit 3 [Phoronopsis harmeri]
MNFLFMTGGFCVVLVLILLVVCLIVSFSGFLDREKASPFECGFDPSDSARTPFSLRFFLLAVIFLIFDIEIVLLMPFPMMDNFSGGSEYLISASLFLLVLILGLFFEWTEGSLEWMS